MVDEGLQRSSRRRRQGRDARERHESTPLSGAQIIVVEDNYLLAQSLKSLFERYGCKRCEMVGNVEAGLELIDRLSFDVAVLDIQLDGENVTPVAQQLRVQGTPIIYVSGYGDLQMLPHELRGFPRLDKPAEPAELLSNILAVLPRT